jgi:dipeptidyl aminopeptidase/acylaminoacyl peptidase
MKTQGLRRIALVLCLLLLASVALAQKRPLAHRDYDSWRAIQSQTLSSDGKFLAYGLFPQAGDGEVVIRNLATAQEWRQPAGQKPEPPRPNPLQMFTDEEPPQVNVKIAFTPDSRFVVFSTFPTKAEVEKAKKEKKKADDMPRGGMVIVDVLSGEATRFERIKSFQVPTKAGSFVAFLHEPEKKLEPKKEAGAPDTPAAPPAGASREKKKEYGSELSVKNFASGETESFPDVTEYAVANDGTGLAYAVSAKDESLNGVYAVFADMKEVPARLIAGPGKYLKLAFDEKVSELAFVSDRDDLAARPKPDPAAKNAKPGPEPPTKFTLYLWKRGTPAAQELVGPATPGFREGYLVSEKANINFSRDGQRIFFGCAPPTPPEKEETESSGPAADDDKAHADLWHWKDDFIQPMQKVRAQMEKRRTYGAVYHLPEKKLVQLADSAMSEVTPSEDGLWALGGDDREYRSMVEYDTRYLDSYLVDTRSGVRRPLLKKHIGRVTWSPDGRFVLYFNGGDWHTVSTADLKTFTLQPKDGVKFWDEEHDEPGLPPAYGAAGWTRDGKYVLLYDEFDVWRFTPDGSEAVNLTSGLGRRNHLIFRYVNLNPDRRDPEARWIDPGKPLLLRAQNKDTRDSGFYRLTIDGRQPPQRVLMEARNFTSPVQAKNAQVLLFTASSFREFPNLLVSGPDFTDRKKVSDANPQMSQFLWGTAELVRYRSADGVPLQGILYKPDNFDAAKKYPLLVYIYERLSQGLHQFHEPRPSHNIVPSYYASNGYLVLLPDIAYTIGSPGQSALRCVLPAIDAVVAQGFVKEDAIGIQGHSWGGYQIAYMITQTNRFRAAAAGAPVADMISAYDGIRWGPGLPRQFQYEKSQSRIGATPWQAPLKYIENSPIFMADRVHTPLLMLHNDADDAVPWYQGIEYYLALRRLGKEVYMFTYNGEPHGLRRRPDQKDYTVRLQQFFDHYLKGAPAPEWMEKGIPYLQRDQEKEQLKKTAGYD